MRLCIKNLSKQFGKNLILNNINFEIPKGRITALLGPNGSGKSTLIKCILGIVQTSPDAIIETSPRIAYMPQVPAFPSYLNVGEIIQLFNDLHKAKLKNIKPKQKKIDDSNKSIAKENDKEKAWQEKLINEMKICDFLKKKINQISPGMRQKLNILQCFMFSKDVFLLDEPSAGLDLHMLHYLKNLLKAQKESGKTILYTSHVMPEVEILADEMILLYNGRIALQISPKDAIEKQKATDLEEALRLWLDKKQNQ